MKGLKGILRRCKTTHFGGKIKGRNPFPNAATSAPFSVDAGHDTYIAPYSWYCKKRLLPDQGKWATAPPIRQLKLSKKFILSQPIANGQ
jgi:hypothetical protein